MAPTQLVLQLSWDSKRPVHSWKQEKVRWCNIRRIGGGPGGGGSSWRFSLPGTPGQIYDFSSFYSDAFPLILAASYWRIYLCFLLFTSSLQQIFWHCPFLKSLHLAGRNPRWIDTNTIDWYYWSCWQPIVSIHRLKMFHFWLIVSIIGPHTKKIFPIESNHQLKIFSSSKDHWSNWCFFS
jgi:hypothetical protein